MSDRLFCFQLLQKWRMIYSLTQTCYWGIMVVDIYSHLFVGLFQIFCWLGLAQKFSQ